MRSRNTTVMEIAVYILGTLVVIAGLCAGLMDALGHKSSCIWLTVAAVCAATLGAGCWFQDREWNKGGTSPSAGSNTELISGVNRGKFIKFLEYAPKGPVFVGSLNADPDTISKVSQLRSLLDQSGDGIQGEAQGIKTFPGAQLDTKFDTNIVIIVYDLNNLSPYAVALQKAFSDIQITAPFVSPRPANPFIQPGEVMVIYFEKT